MSRIRRSFLFVAFTAALASSISLIGGLGLEYVQERILPLVPLLIAIPSLTNLVGEYAAIIASHTGDPAERKRSHLALAKVIFTVIWFNIFAIVALSILSAMTRGYGLDADFALRFFIFIAAASIVTVLFMFLLAKMLDRLLLKRHINPDELLVPVITSLADIVMLLLVTLAVLTIF